MQAQVMIIEDEPEVMKLFTSVLLRKRYRVLEALGGSKALEILATISPDIALVDLAMPGTTGVEILRYLTETPRLATTAVVVITARTNMLHAIEAYRVDAVLTKPVSIHQLTRILETMI